MFSRSRRRVLRAALIVPILLSAGACTTMAPEPQFRQPENWEQFAKHQQGLKNWVLSGRLGVQSEDDGGSFDLHWQQRDDTYTIRLIAPLGRGTVLIHGDDEGVSIRMADGTTEYSNEPDALFARMTGIELPVSAMREWLRGLPVDAAAIERIAWDEAGQIYRLSQLGWRIEMSRYQANAGYVVPHAFYLEHLQQQELNVRLIIRSWSISPSEGEVAS